MADVQDIARARRALARADRLLGALARRYGDVIDDTGYEPEVDQAAIHWPTDWLRKANRDEIFAWIAHHVLAWALGHEWRLPGRPLANYYETVSRWWTHPTVELPRMASLIETSCVLYFSGRRPRGWRPLIDPEILKRWRGIPAEAILDYLRIIPDRMTYKEWLTRGPMDEGRGDPDGDSDTDWDSEADDGEDSDAGGDPDTDWDAEADDASDSDADGDAAAIFQAISDGDGDIDGNTDADGDGNSDTGTDGGGKTDADGDRDGDNDRDGSGSPDSDADSDADADAEGDTFADADDDGEMDGDPDGDSDTDGDARDADADDDGDADTADGRGDQPAPVSWRIRVQPPPEPIWVMTLLVESSGSDRPDYLRHHRRHAASPVVIPSRRGDSAIVVSRDCSGSISDDQIKAETVAIRALRAAHPEARIVLVDHDSTVARVVDDPSDEDLALRPCDGGTDFRPVFDEAESMELSGTRIACLVLISDDLDGYMPEPEEEPRYPVVWLTSRWVRASVPFGEVIRYD